MNISIFSYHFEKKSKQQTKNQGFFIMNERTHFITNPSYKSIISFHV